MKCYSGKRSDCGSRTFFKKSSFTSRRYKSFLLRNYRKSISGAVTHECFFCKKKRKNCTFMVSSAATQYYWLGICCEKRVAMA